jgi:aspartyl-tRNA(Asn)/glutamyl-tRNA(Gln) amidotransferase subunit A
MGPLAVGTDGGGSIRIPCSFTGLFGLKPSFGRVPAWPLSPMGTVAHVGR